MKTKEDFRKFVSSKPSLAKYVQKGDMTWQKFYEMYDLYGEDNEVWSSYLKEDPSVKTTTKINDLIKNVDIDSIKQHIDTAQKALDFVQELTNKTSIGEASKIVTPRPLNKFFED